MEFRFTLNNSIEGSQVINEPDGWKDIKIKLERSPDYHSLIEMIDSSFFFYNRNSFIDGGRIYLANIVATQGLNALISILIELTEDGNIWDTVFLGNLDLSTIVDLSKGNKFYKFQCAIIPSDMWSLFLSRKATKIDLNAAIDLDGNPTSPTSEINLPLPSQKVRLSGYYSQYNSQLGDPEYVHFGINHDATNIYFNMSLPKIVLDEIPTRYTYQIGGDATTVDPSSLTSVDFELIDVKFNGTYVFDCRFETSNIHDGLGGASRLVGSYVFYIEIDKQAPIAFTDTRVGTDFVNGRNVHTYSGSMNLIGGQRIKIYFKNVAGYIDTTYIIGDGTLGGIPVMSYISIVSDTTFSGTRTDAILIHDAANSLIKKMTGTFDVYSDYLGGFSQGYDAQGCGHRFAIMLGLHVRGYTFIQKPFAMSFDEWWSGANPILNLGLGPEFVNGVERIRIESKDHFYDDNPILYFDNVEGIESGYDKSKIFNSIEIGFPNWSAESASGIDDPQTKHIYSTIFKIIGQGISLLSTWFAASLGIEQTRRNKAEQAKDWRLDNNIIIIALDSNEASPESFVPEVGSPFTVITNLLNPDTRYNVRLTPYRNIKRWLKYLSGCLQSNLSDPIRFNSGEGNYTMSVGANSDACDTGTWVENQDVIPLSTPYFTPETYTVIVDLTWSNYKLLRAFRHRAIAISQTDANHKICHISSLAYDIAHAKASIKCWIK